MKKMIYELPPGSCPSCNHKQFIIHEAQMSRYVTDGNGEIIAHKDTYYNAKGMCINCNKVFEMMPTTYGFIPCSPLKKFLYDHQVLQIEKEIEYNIDNPMEVNNEK